MTQRRLDSWIRCGQMTGSHAVVEINDAFERQLLCLLMILCHSAHSPPFGSLFFPSLVLFCSSLTWVAKDFPHSLPALRSLAKPVLAAPCCAKLLTPCTRAGPPGDPGVASQGGGHGRNLLQYVVENRHGSMGRWWHRPDDPQRVSHERGGRQGRRKACYPPKVSRLMSVCTCDRQRRHTWKPPLTVDGAAGGRCEHVQSATKPRGGHQRHVHVTPAACCSVGAWDMCSVVG